MLWYNAYANHSPLFSIERCFQIHVFPHELKMSDKVFKDFCLGIETSCAPSKSIVERQRGEYVPLEVVGT